MVFAVGEPQRTLKEVVASEYWDAALITLDTCTFVSHQELEHGIFKCQYPGHKVTGAGTLSLVGKIARGMSNHTTANQLVDVLLIDVATFFAAKANTGLTQAIHNAERDQEWLILPLDPSQGVSGELTAKLDDGCISNFECFRFQP